MKWHRLSSEAGLDSVSGGRWGGRADKIVTLISVEHDG